MTYSLYMRFEMKPVKHGLLQELGYMARRGHETGIISTYEYTWLLKTNRSGQVWVSDAIHFARQGDASCASVTEVDKLSC